MSVRRLAAVPLAALAAAALAAPCSAGPAGVRVSATATGFPGAFAASVGLGLRADPFHGSALLDSLQGHLRAVAGMRSPEAVRGYLVEAAAGTVAEPKLAAERLRETLGREPMPAHRAAALLLANALARPEQFQETLEALESQRAGLGRHAAEMLAGAKGGGDPRLLAALRAAGARAPAGRPGLYNRAGELDALFDGAGPARGVLDSQVPVSAPAEFTGYGPDGLPRPSGLRPPPKLDVTAP